MIDMTGCDAVMIGRGCEGNPFIFRQVNEYLKNGNVNLNRLLRTDLRKRWNILKCLLKKRAKARNKRGEKAYCVVYQGTCGSSRLKGEVFKISDIATMRICLTDYINQL